MKETRQLSAIMFTDIVGYTSLMGKDEAKALLYLDHKRKLLQPLLDQYSGEMLKEIGDGTLSRFRSAVDAVECAIKIQQKLLGKEEYQIRIGIHVGDVVFKGGDIFGDGVNVASRIEPLARPGGICISGAVVEYIRNQTKVQSIFLGAKRLKNVSRPVKVYALTGKGLISPKVSFNKQLASSLPPFLIVSLIGILIISSMSLLWYFSQKQPQSDKPAPGKTSVDYPAKRDIFKKVEQLTPADREQLRADIRQVKEKLRELDIKIIAMETVQNDVTSGSRDGLIPMLSMVKEKEQAQKQLDELQKKLHVAIENDISVYETIVHSSSGKHLQDNAWKRLVSNYPETELLAVEDLDMFKLLLLKEWIEPTTGIEFVLVEAGCFRMGDKFGDGDEDEKPVHEVCVDTFAIARYELTQGQWKKLMGNNPSKFTYGDDYPVENVSWIDTQDFIRKFNSSTGKTSRLPTEAEWEYAACPGEQQERYPGGEDIESLAWYKNNSTDSTHPVGEKEPNFLGLFDMGGNVWEWCFDWYGNKYYQQSLQNNPTGPSSGSFRIVRNGCWNGSSRLVRCSNREAIRPGYRLDNLGFRPVLQIN